MRDILQYTDPDVITQGSILQGSGKHDITVIVTMIVALAFLPLQLKNKFPLVARFATIQTKNAVIEATVVSSIVDHAIICTIFELAIFALKQFVPDYTAVATLSLKLTTK
jgi:hypothetical protein